MSEHGYPSSFVYYTYELWSLAPEIDSNFFIKYVTSNIYREASVRILISLNNCLQGILELTPTIDRVTLFCILNIVLRGIS